MKVFLVLAALSVALAAVAVADASAAVKPKPWQWTPAKMNVRLVAAQPVVFGDEDLKLTMARCTGQGKAVAGRFSRFQCTVFYATVNIQPLGMRLFVRLVPVGSGKLCVPVNADGTVVEPVRSPSPPKAVAGRACP